jgi:hypothetical protein
MSYVFESLNDFLFEDLGNLKKFNLPKEILGGIIKTNGFGYYPGGRESKVDIVENPKDYQKLLKALKPEFIAGVISVDGEARFIFNRSSERKFKMYDIKKAREQEIEKKKRDEERKQRDLEWERRNSGVNEGRSRGGYHYYDPANMGEYSTQTLSDFIKKLEGDVTLELIRKDLERDKKIRSRSEIRQKEDPLSPGGRDYYRAASTSQSNRYEKFATKKRLQIDKDIESEKEKIRKQIEDNFDRAFDEIIKDLRKGYSWSADPKNFTEKMLKGINFSGIQKIAKAYDAVEPGQGSPDAAQAAIKKLRDLGYK